MILAIIGAGDIARLYAIKARELGVTTLCFAWEQGAVAKPYVDSFYPISIMEKEKILDICKRHKIDGVIYTTELTLSVANFVAYKMGLQSNPVDVMENVTNKLWQREKCKRNSIIKQPAYIKLENIEDLYKYDSFQFPVIVKPASEGGKRGIEVAYNVSQLFDCVEKAFAQDKRNKGVLIEQYLANGQEYSVESLSFQGNHQIIQITEKISSGPPHCIELGHSQPAQISKEIKQNIITGIKELLCNVNYQNGAAHTEIKVDNDEIYLIELNARVGGDHISYPLTNLSTGYDYLGEGIKVALGIKPTDYVEQEKPQYAGVRFVTAQTQHLKSIFDSCDNEPWLYEKHVENDTLTELTHNDSFHVNYFIYYSNEIPEILQKG